MPPTSPLFALDSLEQRRLLSASTLLLPGGNAAWENPSQTVSFAGSVWFTAGRVTSHLFRSDGTTAATLDTSTTLPLLQGANFSSTNGSPFVVGGTMYLTVGSQLWMTDGTGGGTVKLADQIGGAYPTEAVYGGKFYFSVPLGNTTDIYVSDGTVTGTKNLTSTIGGTPTLLGIAGGRVYLNNGGVLSSTIDGSTITPIATLSGVTPVNVQAFRGAQKLLLVWDTNFKQKLWVTDDTVAGTRPTDVALDVYGAVTVYNGLAYFFASPGNGSTALWQSDGTLAGTRKIVDSAISLNYTYYPPVLESAVFAGRLYLGAHGQSADNVVTVDAAGAVQVLDGYALSAFHQYGDRLYFGEISSFVTSAAPSTVVRTDGLGPSIGTGDGHYFVVSLPDSTNTRYLYTWDSTLPYYGSVHGTVYSDLDGDGVRDSEDLFLRAPVRVYLDYNGNGTYDAGEASTTTDTIGVYRIDQALGGNWPLRVADEAGVVAPSGSTIVNVIPGSQTAYTSTLASYKGRLVGTVFFDANGNGVRDGAEYGLSGMTVYLASTPTAPQSAGDPIAQTDSAGQYIFSNFTSLNGYVRVVTGAVNYVRTTPAVASSVPAGTVGAVAGPAVGLMPPGTARVDYVIDLDADGLATASDPVSTSFTLPVWADLNGNGVFDAGEPAALLADEGSLANLPAGSVTLHVVPPQGWHTSLPGNAFTVTVTSNTVVRSPQFLVTPNGSPAGILSGVVAEDTNFNGSVDAGETAAPLVLLWDDADNDAVRDVDEAFAVTRSGGAYGFASLPSGARTIRMATTGAYVTKNGVYAFPVDAASTPTLNLPVYAPARSARIGGQVRLDANQNGVLDDTDPPLKGVYVQPPAYNSFNAVPPSSTDAGGRFSALVSGGPNASYVPSILFLPGYTLVGTTPSVVLPVGATKDDFVLLVSGPSAALGSVRGTLFVDDNGNGVRDPGEAPIANAKVLGDLNNNGVANTNEPVFKTAADGSYSFTGIPTANFSVIYASAAAYETVTNASGAVRGRLVAVNGQDVAGVDLGIGRFAYVSGTIFRDYDHNGVKGADDTGAAGIRVWADANANGVFDAGDSQAVTGAGGTYSLPVGTSRTLKIYADLPAGSTAVTAASTTLTTGAMGSTSPFSVAFYDSTALVTGRVYYDRNFNGLMDADELTYANAPSVVGQIMLYDAAGTQLLGTASTAWNDPTFRFGGLAAGTYRLVFTPGSGNEVRENAGGITFTVSPQQVLGNQRFGWRQPRIGYTGRVMQDFGQKELPDAADVPLAGVRAFVDLNGDYLYEPGEYAAVSDAAGYFAVAGIEFDANTGNYPRELVIENPHGMRQAYPYMTSRSFYMGATSDTGTVLFSPPRYASAVGYVYKDLNTNGVRDPGEPGIAYKQVGQDFGPLPFFDAVVTDREGLYIYADSHNGGVYSLKAQVGSGWIATDPLFGGSKTVTVPADTVVTGPDFGFVDFQIGGRLFVDANGNGKLDGVESPIVGRRVWIDADQNGVYDTGERSTVSDADGYFAFADTGGGTFHLAQEKPAAEAGVRSVNVTVQPGGATGGITFNGQGSPLSPATFILDDGTGQRSRVRQAVVTLGATVTAGGIASGAFVLSGAAAQGVVVSVVSVVALLNGRTAVTLGFSGSGLSSGSLADGAYTLSVNGSRITDTQGRLVDAAGNGTAGSSASTRFYRLFGDIDASGKVDFNDFLWLQNSFGSTSGRADFLPGLDGTGDNVIDFNDFLMLQNNFGHTADAFPAAPTAVPTAPAVPITPAAPVTPIKMPPAPSPVLTAPIAGVVYRDNNHNGRFDKGDGVGRGTTVYLDLNGDGVRAASEPAAIADSQGRFAFRNLTAGTYRVRQVLPAGRADRSPARLITLTRGQAVGRVELGSR